jgi:hypothetical protein
MKRIKQVGVITEFVINLLGLDVLPQPIFLGESNMTHILTDHPEVCNLMGTEPIYIFIERIIENPEFVGFDNGTFEYVKDVRSYDFVKVPVRPAKSGIYFVRTMYFIGTDTIRKGVSKGTLKRFEA